MADLVIINIYFLIGIPRAGNTLFGSIMNQNQNVRVSSYSAVPLLINNILRVKEYKIYLNFPDHRLVDNVLENLFENYYAPLNVDNIIDRGAWGLDYLLPITKHLIKNRKYIILYRPILEALASFVKEEKPDSVHKLCDHLMTDGILMQNIKSIQNIVNSNEKYRIIHYDNFVNDPIYYIKNTCEFLNIPYIEPNLYDIKQFGIDGYRYDDTVAGGDFHLIRTNEIKKNDTNIEDYLPIDIIDKYKDYELKFND